MVKIVYLACPGCKGEFYVGPEFLEIEGAYCHCPYCGKEFKPQESPVPLRY